MAVKKIDPTPSEPTAHQKEVLETIGRLNRKREHVKNMVKIHKREHKCMGICDVVQQSRRTIKDLNAQVWEIGKAEGLL